jgi:hypothetical protein
MRRYTASNETTTSDVPSPERNAPRPEKLKK